MIATILFSRVFHGSPDQIARVRRDVQDYLSGCLVPDDAADNAVLIASELATNAVRHSRSRGAFFVVRCEVFPSYTWVECEDLGGPWLCKQQDGRPHGLDIVQALVGEGWGTEVTTDGERITWARIDLEGHGNA